MGKNRNKFGFSLTELVLALGTLSIGMIFVAGVFPVAIYFSTQASEQTIAAVVAGEAFAKIRLFAVGDPTNPADDIDLYSLKFDALTNFVDALPAGPPDLSEFAYPSDPDPTVDVLGRKYWWSAFLRRAGTDPCSPLVQVTVFVSRKTSPGTMYRNPDPIGPEVAYPMPVPVAVKPLGGNVLSIDDASKTFINDGYTISHGQTGRLYRVLERRRAPDDATIVLDGDWIGMADDVVWVVPPPQGGGRYPCIAVYQKLIRF